jgi:diguanylate cyclase (GGDEF)-like protein
LEDHIRRRTRELEVANDQIRQLSLVDELTGLHNRRGFFLLAEQELKAAARLQARVFLMFVDADGLKSVNDLYGHAAGDDMPRQLAHVLKSTFRSADIVARLGGDEFCVFGLLTEGASDLPSERLKSAIAQFNATSQGPCQLAASAGVYSFLATSQRSLDAAVAEADRAMYAEKRARRSVA